MNPSFPVVESPLSQACFTPSLSPHSTYPASAFLPPYLALFFPLPPLFLHWTRRFTLDQSNELRREGREERKGRKGGGGSKPLSPLCTDGGTKALKGKGSRCRQLSNPFFPCLCLKDIYSRWKFQISPLDTSTTFSLRQRNKKEEKQNSPYEI